MHMHTHTYRHTHTHTDTNPHTCTNTHSDICKGLSNMCCLLFGVACLPSCELERDQIGERQRETKRHKRIEERGMEKGGGWKDQTAKRLRPAKLMAISRIINEAMPLLLYSMQATPPPA